MHYPRKIHKLSEKTIKQIAAGEVIARPANAIKELVENAIDAGATEITIHIDKAGLERIVIIDNGHGMSLEDLSVCTQLHTTSKTNDDDHMFGTHSFGFRGEALASINTISQMTIESNGNKLTQDTTTPSNVTNGTRIEILNMFASLPARLKFLKSSQVEWFHIKTMLEKFIISECNISWNISHNGKKLWQFHAGEDVTYRIEKLLNSNAHSFSHEYKGIKISGHLLDISARNFCALFVNKRCVIDKAIAQYLRNIFSEYYMKHENPGYIISIEIDPMMVDCNVHPAKAEVRIINHSDIFAMFSFIFTPDFFNRALKKEQRPISESIIYEASNITEHQFSFEYTTPAPILNFVKEPHFEYQAKETAIKDVAAPIAQQIYPVTEHRIIGQIRNSFIIFESADGIGIFDQHAAHERHIYERMKNELATAQSQQLLIPVELNLTPMQAEYLNTHKNGLLNSGIIIDGKTLTHIPQTLPALDFAKFIETELDENSDIETLIDRLVADTACKNALKANTALSFEQMSSLLETALNQIPICNHGRPVFKYFTYGEVETWFRRK